MKSFARICRIAVGARFASPALLLCAAGCGKEGGADFVSPVYADPCRFVRCANGGVCTAGADEQPICNCAEGYTGAHCEGCAVGYHVDARKFCVPDRSCAEQDRDPCGAHGFCTDDLGVVACTCDPGYEGARCELCAPGHGRNSSGECLQQFIYVDGGMAPLPATCTDDSCHGHGRCSLDKGAVRCDCDIGYAGNLCDLCSAGYAYQDGRCVDSTGCNAGACGVCERFTAGEDFPEAQDTCVLDRDFATKDVQFTSSGGSGSVWLCAGSEVYDIATAHVALEAGTAQPARLGFNVPVVSLSFDYVPRSTGAKEMVSLELKADDMQLAPLRAERMMLDTRAFTFDKPVSELTIRSMGVASELVALDNVVYKLAMCQ